MFDIVSAIIINRNRRQDLEECVQSIKDQTYKSIQILIVDNNSTDGSNYNIKLPYNLGVTLPTNIGVASSLGDYILLVDNDAILDKKFVEFALYIMKVNANIGVVSGRILNDGKDLEYECYGSDLSQFTSQYMGTFYACVCLIRRSCWDQVGGYNRNYFAYYQEHDFAARIIKRGWKIWYEPCCLAEHKMVSTERSPAGMIYFLTRNHYLFIWEHLPFWLAVFQSIKWVGWSIIKGRHHPYTVLRAYLGVIQYIPHSIKNRKPLTDTLFIRPWKKVLRSNRTNAYKRL
jgi:GT2 family glycosyltransferase